jgi:hypothetical protein
VKGESGVGKTTLVYWCLAHCARRGHRHGYVDLSDVDLRDGRRPDFLALLRLVRDGKQKLPNEKDDPSPLRVALRGRKQAFLRFDRDLNWILQGRRPPGEDPGSAEEDKMLPFDASAALPDPFPPIFTSFRAALERAADDQPLVLALDHFAPIRADGTRGYLRPHFFNHVAAGEIKGVRMILVVTPDDYRELDLANVHPAPTLVEVTRFQRRDFAQVAKEYCNFRPGSPASVVLTQIAQSLKEDFDPAYLENVYRALELLDKVES